MLGTPFLRIQFGSPDDRVLPPGASAHQVGDMLRGGNTNAARTTLAGSMGKVDAKRKDFERRQVEPSLSELLDEAARDDRVHHEQRRLPW